MAREDLKESRLDSVIRRADSQGEGLEAMAMLAELRERVFGGDCEPLAIGGYRILRRVGVGGMGVVYEAYDPKLERHVALKVVKASTVGTTSRSLLREARAIAKLSHPNVVAVYEAGDAGDETFIAMELVKGGDLEVWQKQRRPYREVLAAYLQAGEGLAAAHTANLVHGDFKPKNALIGEDGRVRVADFGLARGAALEGAEAPEQGKPDTRNLAATSENQALEHTPGGAAPRLLPVLPAESSASVTHLLAGTPLYMAPEQHAFGRATPASDQFSFSVALYEALYGEHPFGTGQDVVDRICRGEMLPEAKGPRVPAWVRRAVLRGFAQKPEERWPSLQALLAELRKDPATTRRRWLFGASAVLAAAAIWMGVEVAEARRAAICAGVRDELAGTWGDGPRSVVQRAILDTKRPFAGTVWAQVERVLSKYADEWVGQRAAACELAERAEPASAALAARRIECLEERRNEMQGVVHALSVSTPEVALGAVAAASSLSPLASCADDRLLSEERKSLEDPALRDRVRATRQQVAEAAALQLAANYEAATKLAEASVQAAESLGYAPLRAEALFRLGALLVESSTESKKGAELLERAVWTATAAKHDRIVALAATWIMSQSAFSGAFDEAERWRSFAAAALERVGRGGIEEAHFENDVAVLLNFRGDFDAAVSQHRFVIDLKRRLFGEDHIDVARSVNNLAVALEDAGDFEEALREHDKALTIYERVLGSSHPYTGASHGNRGMVLALEGRYAEAERDLDLGLGIVQRTLGATHPFYGGLLVGRCRVETKQGRSENGIRTCTRAVELNTAGFGAASPYVAEAVTMLAEAELEAGRLDAARATAERAFELVKAAPRGGGKVAETRFILARALAAEVVGGKTQGAANEARAAERARALTFAGEARDDFRLAGPGWHASFEEVETWLRRHSPARAD